MVRVLNKVGERLLPVLITAGSLLGFVAFAGAVIVWTRFEAVKVPPEQAVNAVSREELISVGASLLLIFGFFGVIAVVATYLVDRRGRATPGMARWLLCLLAVEGVTSVILVEGISTLQTALFGVFVVLVCLAGIGVTYVESFTRFRDDFKGEHLEREESNGRMSAELLDPLKPRLPFRWSDDSPWVARLDLVMVLAAVLDLALVALVVVLLDPGILVAVILALPAVGALALLLVGGYRIIAGAREHLAEEEEAERKKEEPLGGARHRPYRLYLRAPAVVLLALLLGAMVVVPAVALGQWWLTTSLGAAVVIVGGLWRIAALPKHGFMWFGLAVFISVPLFGTLTLMARNLVHPQVQPLALIRKTDGPYEAIQGLYVTEGDERVYFANVATEGCTDAVTPNSGRLLWVPKSEVVALSIGPAQNLKGAAQTALEMSYALTPGAETPSGAQTTLTVGDGSSQHDRRLESSEPAVRPNFGGGLSLSPEEVSPGQAVTLRMSAPNKNPEVKGFGEVREGRTLRVGGVPADIVKEASSEARRAEYVETTSGQVLNLAKHEPYVERGEGEFVPLKEAPWKASAGKYVKLIDKAVISAEGGAGKTGAFYLPLESSVRPATLEGSPAVELRGVEEAGLLKLKPHPLTQAWHESKIRFQVPENAASGPVTVECSQLEGQPFLRVSKPPMARIGARVKVGTDRVVFDSRRSVAAGGKIAHRRWLVDGLPEGHGRRLSMALPARYAPYRVRLYVTNSNRKTDFAEASVLRLPVAALEPGHRAGGGQVPKRERWFRRLRHALERTARVEHPVEVDVDGFAGRGRRGGHAVDDAKRSLHWADLARRRLLPFGSGLSSSAPTATASSALDGVPSVEPTVPVKIRAFGHSCPASGDVGGEDRVEVFLLEDGAKVTSPAGCRARRTDRAEWLPPH